MPDHTDLIARLKALYPSETHAPTVHEAIAALAASPTAAPDVAALIARRPAYAFPNIFAADAWMDEAAAALLAQQRTIAELERERDDIKQVEFPRRMAIRRAMYDAWAANRPEPAAAPDVAALIARLMKCPPIAPDRDLYVVSGLLRAEVADRIEQLVSERDAAVRDTARLDWLERLPHTHAFGKAPSGYWMIFGKAGDLADTLESCRAAIDAAIDAAIEAAK